MLLQAQLKLKGESWYKHQCDQMTAWEVPVYSLSFLKKKEKMHLSFPYYNQKETVSQIPWKEIKKFTEVLL